jgi:cell wall-associated NlpC family hydrolase
MLRFRHIIALRRPSRRTLGLLCGVLLLATTIACGAAGTAINGTPSAMDTMSDTVPRWVCPSATPLPLIQVEDGTEQNDLGTPMPNYRDTDPYEREYGIGNRPPPRPTPYSKGAGFQATNAFFLNQIVNWRALDLRVSVNRSQPHPNDANKRLYYVHLEWNNRGTPFSFEPTRQIAVTAIGTSSGRMTAGDWRSSTESRQISDLAGDPLTNLTVAAGRSALDVPIVAPDGRVTSVDLQLDQVGTTTGTDLRLHFTTGRAPECSADGTWDAAYSSPYKVFSGVAAPPGADVLVATALQYLGRQYCWGGHGYTPCDGFGGGPTQETPACASYPCFDCSGLTWFVYKEHGWPISQGTVNQKTYPPVSPEQIQPGDLMLFSDINVQGRGSRITHVGLYAGDLDGDGTGDMIHAANYPTGVVTTKNVFGNLYYKTRLVVITRPPRGGGL